MSDTKQAVSWHAAKMGNDSQGLVIDDTTGANIAVTYDKADAPLIAAAPQMYAALREIVGVAHLRLALVELAEAALRAAEGKPE